MPPARDKFTYLADPALTKALRELMERTRNFLRTVIQPWINAHPDLELSWVWRLGIDGTCLGFVCKNRDAPVPIGLSANQNRGWLIPKRGKAGDPWRADLSRLNRYPKLSSVLHEFEIEPTILVIDHGRRYTPGLVDTTDGYYLTWGHKHPDPGPHLTLVPLSAYYVAIESAERET